MPHIALDKLPAFSGKDGDLTVVVETPRGDRNKFSYDPEIGAFRLKFVLPDGMAFPYDFGFVPSTKGEDGDPIDVLLLLESGAALGAVVAARPIGSIRAMQREGDGNWCRNDRLIGVALPSRHYKHVVSLDDLRDGMVEEIVAFFEQYNRLNGKEFRFEGTAAPAEARASVREAGLRA